MREGGFTAVTLDHASQRAGVSKGGLLYHFPTRQALIDVARHYVADAWEAGMEAYAGGTAETLPPSKKLAAYISAASSISPEVEIIFLAQPRTEDQQTPTDDPMEKVTARWSLPCPPPDAAPALHAAYALQLAADGLWLAEATYAAPHRAESLHLVNYLLAQIPADLDEVIGASHRP